MVENLVLPEKPFFTVQEVAVRWEADVAYVLLLFRDAAIIPAYTFYQLSADVWIGDAPEVEPDGSLEFDGTCVESDVLFSNSEFYVWSYTRQKKMADDIGRACILLKDAFLTKEPRGRISQWFIPNPKKHDQLIPAESMVITRQELKHVEKKLLKSKPKPLNPHERDRLLMTIGVLAGLLADSIAAKYGSSDKVKVQPIADAMGKHMAKAGIPADGFSPKTLAKRIDAGLKKLKLLK